jgi:hypothetical protein
LLAELDILCLEKEYVEDNVSNVDLLTLQVAKLVEMGFSEPAAKSALESCGGDENAALEKLCSG